ncbi:MAG TPA: dipeptide epimerase [Thermoanaerobaculia bacterium]|nr:dipeptide epimerase [Thermoanaerobaculia bacterium]HQR67218.1 dipeptide epimerase [Thermoanaerobaculia bacterium]
MTSDLSRRSLLSTSAALAAGAFLPEAVRTSQAAAAAPAAGGATLSLAPLELKLTHTWTISRSSSNEKKNGLLTLAAGGVTGYGEAAANVRYGQSWESGEAAFARVKKAVEGLSPWEHLVWLERAEKEAGGDSQIVAALDMALWDWKGKKLGAPVHRLLGMPEDRMAVTTFTIGIDTPEVMQKKVAEGEKYPSLKVKVGLPTDEQNVRAIRAVTAKPIRVDANEGWQTPEEAIARIGWLAGMGVEFVEQPMPASKNAAMKAVKAASPLPLVADESVLHPPDIPSLVGLFDGINVKLAKCGGITRACEMAAIGRALGFKLMLGCMIESSLGIAAGVAVAPLYDWLDLDGNLLISNDPFKGLTIVDGRWREPAGPGLGVVRV